MAWQADRVYSSAAPYLPGAGGTVDERQRLCSRGLNGFALAIIACGDAGGVQLLGICNVA